MRPNLDDFPPVPSDHPPGASDAAWTTAAALRRGVNFGSMLDPPHEGDWGLRLEDGLFTVARRAGFATVRLTVRWSNHAEATPPFAIDPAFLRRVEGAVDRALAAGFHVILDMHHHRQLDGDGLDVGEIELSPEVLDVRFLVLWQQIAERFRDRSGRLLLELYNEPHNRLDDARWNELAARALGVVRRSDPDRLVVIDPTERSDAGKLSALRVPNDANLIVAIHDYEPFEFTHQGSSWVHPPLPIGITCCSPAQQARILAPLDVAAAWSAARRYPVTLGEFGSSQLGDLPSRARYTRFVRDAAEARGMSWTYWQLTGDFGLYDPAAGAWNAELLEALLGG